MEKTVFGFRLIAVAALVCALCASPEPAHAGGQALCYVNPAAPGPTHDGNSWATAYTSLQTALNPCAEIWVKAGVYKPGILRADSFVVREGQRVYGGFAGFEISVDQRNPAANVTILSGDIDDNDINTDGNHIDEVYTDIVGLNSLNVVKMDGTWIAVTHSTILDGFTITGGDGATTIQADGGGLHCNGSGVNGAGHQCSPTLSQLTISGNRARDGGALYNSGFDGGASNPALTNVTFSGNRAENYGGAVYNVGSLGISTPVFTNVTFTGNSASLKGGAVYNYADFGTSSPTFTNATFQGNITGSYGGAYFGSGSTSVVHTTLTNVTFNGNSGGIGGAIYLSGSSNATLTNVILWGDTAPFGAEIANFGTAVSTIDHSIVQGSGGSGGSWDSDLGTDGGGNFDADPELSPLADNGGFTKTMSLAWGSPAIEHGVNSVCEEPMPANCDDQRGISRMTSLYFDIGALERMPPTFHADFESDGRTDIAYFHPATGLWGILHSSDNFSYAAPQFLTWGQAGDIVAPGDYDGDGRWDPTVRRPSGGGQSAAYLMLLSSTGYNYGSSLTVPAGWPGLGDTPVVGDYNADGKSDPAIWRGSAGVWIIPLSPTFNTYRFFAWGATGDTPVAADVDGDGGPDIGYWRPSTGEWGFLQSTYGWSYDHAVFFSWGTTGDIPVMADYDGDLLADPAVVIPPAGGQSRAYRILLSSLAYDPAHSVTIPAGWPGLGDTPVPADYDGDWKADAAIWRNAVGVWIIPKSSTDNTAYMFVAWGASGDQIAR